MQPVEVGLFVVIVALALALIGTIVRPHLQRRREPGRGPQSGRAEATERPGLGAAGATGLTCPACFREFQEGIRFCPHDARELVPAGDPLLRGVSSAQGPGSGTTCPACHRAFDALKRFCPYDGEELSPLSLAIGGGIGRSRELVAAPPGKICPHCARRYEGEATFCGRDGSELVTVN